MALETEIQAIQQSFQVLGGLDKGAQKRVIDWLISRFNLLGDDNETIEPVANELVEPVEEVKEKEPVIVKPIVVAAPVVVPTKRVEIDDFDTIAEFYTVCRPKKRGDKALVIAAFMQEKEGEEEVGGQRINRELKKLGESSSNITIDINSLEKKGFMKLTRKEGTSQQSRKKYNVTEAGVAHVKAIWAKAK